MASNNLNASSPTGNSMPGTAKNSPRSRLFRYYINHNIVAPQLRIEDDKKFAQVLRRIFVGNKAIDV